VADADLLFPGGGGEMIEAWLDLIDRRMEQAAAAADMTGLGLTRRVRAVIALRLELMRPDREALRRATGWLLLPGNGARAARCLARTVDAIWHAAGERSADLSWYSKRAILAAIYSGTVLVWLRDPSEEDAGALGFLDRRLAGLGRFGRLKTRLAARRAA
jgi:ubiquinone biosynthesis protein COQ9